MPALNYPQYRDALQKEGIAYTNAVGEFERDFYVKDIGMAKGAVGEFVRAAKVSLRKGKKRARVDDKENQPDGADGQNAFVDRLS